MAMILVDEGKLDIDKPVSAFLPAFKGGLKDKVTVRHLLTHSGGQAGGVTYLYKELKGKEAYLQYIQGLDLLYEPGTKTVYTDLGEILLGEVLERVAGQDLESFAKERIFGPLGMKDTMFRPGPELLPRIAPTEKDPWRGRVLRGEVHDENAFAFGGVAAHAGLFGTARGRGPLRADDAERRRLRAQAHRVAGDASRSSPSAPGLVPDSSRALGWDTPSAQLLRGRAVLAALLRPHRLHRHVDVDGPRAQAVRHPAHQPRPSHPREHRDLRGPPRLCRRRRARAGPAMRARRLAGGLRAPSLILASCGENNPLAPDATPSAPTDKGKAPAAAGHGQDRASTRSSSTTAASCAGARSASSRTRRP